MRVGIFASGTGGNFLTAVRLAHAVPDLLEVVLLVSDRPAANAVRLARDHGIPTLVRNFREECGRASDCRSAEELIHYQARARSFHDRIDDAIARFEAGSEPLDLIVLSYNRWIHGRLLNRFMGRMINQHPADLTRLDGRNRRRYVGNNAVWEALRAGERTIRASTFVLDEGHDTGPIICQGPRVTVGPGPFTRATADKIEAHERAASEWPSLICALTLIGRGRVHLSRGDRWADGSAQVYVAGIPLPFGGVDIETLQGGGSSMSNGDVWEEVLHNMAVAVAGRTEPHPR